MQNYKPVRLISFDANKNVVLSDEAVRIFQTLATKELHVLTVAGKYRTGKSYILNRVLLGRSSGFQVGPTINACTKGLWMWPELVKIDINGVIKDCLIIDTEGLGSLEEGENTDLKIFLMAVLLSSYLIYNSVGSIDQKALQSLSLVVNLATILQKENTYDSQQLINSFPSFMWLVRDFSLRLENEKGQPITSQQYLQAALKTQKSGSQVHNKNIQAAERKNMIRRQLKTFFRQRDCFTLIRPTQDEQDLQNLSSLPDKRLRPEFVRLVAALRNRIVGNIRPKKIRGKSITPQGFIELCQYYVAAVNSGKLPSINSHWDNLCEGQSARIINIYKQIHTKRLSQMAEDKKQIQKQHKRILEEGGRKIEESFLGKLEKQLSKERLERILREQLASFDQRTRQKNHAALHAIVQQIVNEQSQLDSEVDIELVIDKLDKVRESQSGQVGEYLYEASKEMFRTILKAKVNSYEHDLALKNEQIEHLESKISRHLVTGQEEKQNYELEIAKLRKQCQNDAIEICRIESLKRKELVTQAEIAALKDKLREIEDENERLAANNQRITQEIILSQQRQKKMSETITDKQSKLTQLQISLIKCEQLLKDESIKCRKLTREKQIIKNKYEEYLQENIALQNKLQELEAKCREYETQNKKEKYQKARYEDDIVLKHNQQMEYQLKVLDVENRNLVKQLSDQRNINEALMMAPQNINFLALKKNYELQKANAETINRKYKQLSTIINSCEEIKCSLCRQIIPKMQIKSHPQNCAGNGSIEFDVSYAYNSENKINMLIDVVFNNDTQWTVNKSFESIRLMLERIGKTSHLFSQDYKEQHDQSTIIKNEERRVYLDEVLHDIKDHIWEEMFLIEFFVFDLHILTKVDKGQRRSKVQNEGNKQDSVKGGLKKKLCLQLQNLEDENKDGMNILAESVTFQKTSKFTRKTFSFGVVD